MQFHVENDASNRAEGKRLREEMDFADSKPYVTTTDDGLFDIHVTYSGHMTMLDQKVVKVLTNAPSYQHCPLCHHKQSDFDNPDLEFSAIDDFVKFGLRLFQSSEIFWVIGSD